MSGAEALAVISIIANIIALTKFSRDFVSQIKEYGDNAHMVPTAFRDIQVVLPLVSSTLTRTGDQVKSGMLDENTCKDLRPVLKGCENKLKQLKVIFNNVMAEEGASKLKRGLMAIKSVWKEKEVKEIVQALDMFVRYLTHYHTSEGVTTKEIDSLKGSMSSMSGKQPETQSPKTHFLVPVQWSDDFTGREEVMAFLQSRLCLEDQHSRVALVGLGGMGKTRTALEYAKRFKKSKEISVFWIYAGTVERFKNSYREIARKFKIPGYQNPESNILRRVKDWLEDDESGRWLMILDNADDAEMLYGSGAVRLANYFPKSDQGSILLTTRFQKVGANFTSTRNTLNLQQMTLVESEMLLKAQLSGDSSGQANNLYQELAEELERTPLALVQAASFMSQNCVRLESYLQMYRKSDIAKIQLLSENFEDDTRDPESKNPIATTWIISFDYIRTHIPQAAELLSLMSVMDAQNIPDFLLPQDGDAVSFNKSVGTLEAFNFISSKTRSSDPLQQHRLFDLHRLVRLAVRNWLIIDNTLNQRTAQVLKILASICSKGSSTAFDLSSLIFPHVIELLTSDLLQCRILPSQDLENEGSDQPSLSDLYSVSTSTQSREAIGLLEKVHTISNLMVDAADLLIYVAFGFCVVGNDEEARGFAVKCVAISAHVYGPNHERTLISRQMLAFVLQRMGEYKHAEQLLRQNVTICEFEYGIQHVNTLGFLLNLRGLLNSLKREQEVREIDETVIQRCQESLLVHKGESDLEILVMLAGIQFDTGDLMEAERTGLRALNGYEAADNDHEVAKCLAHLSEIYTVQGRLELAVDTVKTVLDTRIRYYGRSYPNVMQDRLQLSLLLLKVQKSEEARRQASLALEHISQFYDSSSDTYAYFHSKFDRLFSMRGESLCPQQEQTSLNSPH